MSNVMSLVALIAAVLPAVLVVEAPRLLNQQTRRRISKKGTLVSTTTNTTTTTNNNNNNAIHISLSTG